MIQILSEGRRFVFEKEFNLNVILCNRLSWGPCQVRINPRRKPYSALLLQFLHFFCQTAQFNSGSPDRLVLSPSSGNTLTLQHLNVTQWKLTMSKNLSRTQCSWTFNHQQQIIDQWFTCFLPDTQLPCYNRNVKIYTLYDRLSVQATSTSHSWQNFMFTLQHISGLNCSQSSFETNDKVYEINKIPKMHHTTISL